MARYQRPTDPRETGIQEEKIGTSEPIPWKWLGMGILVTLIGIAFSFAFIRAALVRDPLEVANVQPPGATVIRLTAPATMVPSPTPALPSPTPIPTLTPFPTPDLATPPAELTIGYFAEVFETGGFGVSVRAGPTTDNLRLGLANENERVKIIGGPESGVGFSWWQIQMADGIEGWVVVDFLRPSGKPADWPQE